MNHPTREAIYRLKLEEERTRGQVTWPSPKYRTAPVHFCVEILGFAPTKFQTEILEAATSHARVAVKGARKLGKSKAMAASALHHFCCEPDATSVIVAPTEAQIERVIYFEVLRLHAQSGRCLSCRLRDPSGPRPCPHSACIDGEPSPSCRSGIRVGTRRLFGIAPRNADHMRGISGAAQRYYCDESPGIDPDVFAAAEGNLASGGTLVASGNPSSRTGWFYDAFTRSHAWFTISGSALDSPNVVLGARVVPGLADLPWIESMRAELSEEDPRFQCDVLGEFPSREQDRVVSDLEYAAAIARWELPDDGQGSLWCGIDPAGGEGGDKSVIVIRRGMRMLVPPVRFMGATDRIMAELHTLLSQLRKGRERVTVNYDASGMFGKDIRQALNDLRSNDDEIRNVGLDSKGSTDADPLLKGCGFSRPRDAYWGNLARLIKTSLAMPYDEDLRADLLFGEWQSDWKGRGKLPDKRLWRKILGRSPDAGDAASYAFFEGRVSPGSDITRQIAEKRAARNAEPEPPDAGRYVGLEPPRGSDDFWQDGLSDPRNPANGGRGRDRDD